MFEHQVGRHLFDPEGLTKPLGSNICRTAWCVRECAYTQGMEISDVNGSCLARAHAQQRRGPTAEHMTEVKQNYPTGPARTIANERSLRRAADAANAAAVLMLWALLATVLFLVLFLLLLLPPLLLL